MNTDSLSFAVNAVANIVNCTLNRKHYKQQLSDIEKFVNKFGFECERQLYRCLFQSILTTPYSDTNRLNLLQQLYSDLGSIFSKPNFVTLVRYSLYKGPKLLTVGLEGEEAPEKGPDTGLYNKIAEIAKCLKLNETEKLAFFLCFDDLKCFEKEIDLSKCNFSTSCQLTRYILTQLHSSSNPRTKEIAKKITEDISIKIPSDKKESSVVFLNSPFSESIGMDSNISNALASLNDDQLAAVLISESGTQLSSEILSQLTVTPNLLAKFLFVLCENPRQQDPSVQQRQGDDLDILANLCREFLPSASPLMEIIQAIDSEAFANCNNKIINAKMFGKVGQPFTRFWQFCMSLCSTEKQGISILGALFFGKPWSYNLEFQFGFVVNCIKNQLVSKLLSAGPTGPGPGGGNELSQIIPHLDSLKCQPDFETNPELNNWKYQRVYQVLMDISVSTPASSKKSQQASGSMFYGQIIELFKWPLQNCPDVVTLGLLGCTTMSCLCKSELLNLAVPAFLSNHPNAGIILHTIWSSTESIGGPLLNNNHQWAKQVLLQSMCEYYIKSPQEEQQQRLSRILDVAQDLKALSLLLNSNCYPFVIDLACLASRREYLKLDKWLMDKIQSNGEPFITGCVSFLSRRCSALLGGTKALEASNVPLTLNLPSETLAAMLACLQQCVITPNSNQPAINNSAIPQELSETILTMVANSALLLQKVPRQPPPGVVSNSTSAKSALVNTVQQSASDLGMNNLSLNSSTFAVQRAPFNVSIANPQSQSSLSIATPSLSQAQQPERIRQIVGDMANVFPEMQQNISPEIETEADSYFQRIYNQNASNSMTIDEVLEMLRKFQDSTVKRERDVFICMIRNLFKEYCYFPQYPDKELHTTAQLFGGIIQMGLVKCMQLVVALRFVLEALRKPYGSKMYFFGIAALDRFKTKLKEYPLYCQHLASIPHYKEFPPALQEYIDFGRQEPPLRANLSSNFQQSAMSVPSSSPPTTTGLPQGLSAVPGVTSGFGTSLGVGVIGSNNDTSSGVSTVTSSQQSALNTVKQGSSKTGVIGTNPNSTSSVGQSTTSNSRPSIANATNIDTLLAAGETMYQTPPEAVQDKIAFIVNNLSQINLSQKVEEFKEVIGKDDVYYGWISQYFVMKRASIEFNFHPLYANFLDMLKMSDLTKLVIRETYRNIKVLLRSDKEIANFSDRSLLKNLGHWLGMLTLAKSKAILAIDLRLKDLLIEAYHKGTQELLYVVPFIAKILESCAKSKVFKPPNPWTMGIVKALVELHQEPNLKLNLKFEVEVLCKTLNQDINELFGKSNILKDEAAASRVMQEPQLAGGVRSIPQAVAVSTPQSQASQTSLPQAQLPLLTIPQAQQSLPSLLTQSMDHTIHHSTSPTVQLSGHPQLMPSGAPVSMTPPTSASSPSMHLFNYHEINTSSISGLAQHIVINNNLPLFQVNPALKQFIRPAIERAVQEWIQPVVERSIKISLTTAEQIIKKDFAMESDETKMCMAAQYLIRNLTAGMAMITSKETLFTSITSQLVSAFTVNCGAKLSKELIEATANTIASDNIDLACCFIQKTAIEKAIPELDKRIANEYEVRRKAKLEGRRYCDPSVLTYQAERMPEAIRLKVGSVTPQQFQVYEELGKNIPGFVAPVFDLPASGMNPNISTAPSSVRPTTRNLVTANFPTGQQLMQNLPSNVNNVLPSSTSLVSSANLAAPISVPPVVPPTMTGFSTDGSATMDSGLISLYDKVLQELEQLLNQFLQTMLPSTLSGTMHSVLESVLSSRNNPRELVNALNLIQRVLDALHELTETFQSGMVDVSLLMRARDLYLVILKVLADPRAYGHQWTTKNITKIVLDRLISQTGPAPPLPDELFDILIRSHLINISLMDQHLARLIENAQSPMALAFTMQFIKLYGPQGIHENDVSNVITALLKLSKNAGAANPLALEIHQILEVFRGNSASVAQMEGPAFPVQPGLNQTREFGADPPEFLEKTERLLREWINLYHSTTNINKVFHMYVQSMNQQGILKTDDSITRFFRLSTEICVELCYRFLSAQQNQSNQAIVDTRTKCFNTLDAFAHLIVMLVKHSGTSTGAASESTAKLNLLNKVLGIIASVVIQDQDIRNEGFQHLAYYRIFIILFMELTLGPNNLGLPTLQTLQNLQHQLGFGAVSANHLDPLYETIQIQVLNAFCQTLLLLKPSKAPSFAFAWLDFISHRTFLEKCLNGPVSMNNGASTKGWPLYGHLLIELIKFESPFLRNVELPHSVDLLYKGTLKVLLVLLHDFPEFLCEYCYELCDVIPCNAIQMRNLVLSAFPRNMRLPDPFTPNLKIDSLPEITQAPRGTGTTPSALSNVSFKKDLDSYIRTRSPVTFLSELRGYLQHSVQNQPGDSTPYNIPLINALVLYVGQAAIQSITPKNISMSSIAHSSHMDIFQNLAVDLDTCGRYLFLNAIANQLRYPNSHTHYFSCTLLYLFAESNTEAIQEQITRVLLERLIVNRPHPWGLLVTFIELIKNPSFKFWNHEFVRCAPEIEKLFESVARSCMQQQQKNNHPANNSVQAAGEI